MTWGGAAFVGGWLLVAALGDGLKVLDCTFVIDKDPDDSPGPAPGSRGEPG